MMQEEGSTNRRAFMQKLGGLTAVACGVGAAGGTLLLTAPEARADTAQQRATAAFGLRRDVALLDRNVPALAHASNGDEARYPNRIGNFSKGLPHTNSGEVDLAAYSTLLTALVTGRPEDF